MTEEHDQDNLEHSPAVAEPIVDAEANPVEGEPAGEIDADADGVVDDHDPHPIANDPAVAKAETAEERRERRAKDEDKKPAPKPKADAGLKPQRSATKAGKKKSTYNPGKTPPKPIELKDHSPWYIPWIGTGLIIISLIVLVLNYVFRGLPPLDNWWIPVCFVGMTAGLIVLSRWK